MSSMVFKRNYIGYVSFFALLSMAWMCPGSELVPFRVGDKWGYSDNSGKITVACEYAMALPFIDGRAIAESPSKGRGFISESDFSFHPLTEYSFCRPFSEGLAACSKADKWGFIDKDYNNTVKCQYQEVGNFKDGYARVKKDGRYGYIKKDGSIAVTPKFDRAGDFSEGLAAVRLDNKTGYINVGGDTVIPFMFDDAGIFSESIAPAAKDKLWGFIDKTGKEIIPFKYTYARPFKDGVSIVTDANNQFGAIDIHGNFLIPFGKFKVIRDFSDGLAPAGNFIDKHSFRHGFIDKTGKEIIPFKYLLTEPFHNGLARVYTEKKYSKNEGSNVPSNSVEFIGGGYIDKQGKEYWTIDRSR